MPYRLLFPDDRPCNSCRPCSFNFALFRRDDVLPVLLRALGDTYDARYLALTECYPTFYAEISAPLYAEAARFQAWAEENGVEPGAFCCMSEPRQEYWQEFARAVGLGGLSAEVAHALRHKPTMKHWIRATGLQTAEFIPFSNNTELKRFTDEHGFPVVLKPVAGWGTLKTLLLCSEDDLTRVPNWVWSEEMMVETFIADTEYECCALISEGVVLDVYPSIMPERPLDAAQGALNANISVSAESDWMPVRNLSGLVQQLVSGFGLRQGYLHMEFFASEDGNRICVSELALRYPGCEIAKNHGLARGFDMANATLDVYLGLEPRLQRDVHRCVGDLLLPYSSGLVIQVTSEAELLANEGVIEAHVGVAAGDVLQEVDSASFNCSGWVFVEGDSPLQVEHRMRDVLNVFELRVE